MVDAQVISFTVFALVLALTPGADTFLVIRNVSRGGFKDGVATTFGIGAGCIFHAVFSALGLSVVLMQSAELYFWIKLAGAGYLVWLGILSLSNAVRRTAKDRSNELVNDKKSSMGRAGFIEGVLTNVLNPKVALFYLALLPQFISPADPVLAKSLLLCSIHLVIGTVWLCALSLLLDRMKSVVTKGSFKRALDGVSGVFLIGLGLRLAVDRR